MQEEKSDDLLNVNYDLEPVVADVGMTVEVENEENFAKLPHLEKIRMASKQKGVTILEPKSGCNKCLGRGYTSTTTNRIIVDGGDDLIQETPNACSCIFSKEDLPKAFSGNVTMGRGQGRKYNDNMLKQVRKIRVKIDNKDLLKQQAEQLKAKKKKLRKLKKKNKKRS